jgi:hypothetical protein
VLNPPSVAQGVGSSTRRRRGAEGTEGGM